MISVYIYILHVRDVHDVYIYTYIHTYMEIYIMHIHVKYNMHQYEYNIL